MVEQQGPPLLLDAEDILQDGCAPLWPLLLSLLHNGEGAFPQGVTTARGGICAWAAACCDAAGVPARGAAHRRRLQRVTRAIIAGACGRTAVDLYSDLDRLRELKARRGRAPPVPLLQACPGTGVHATPCCTRSLTTTGALMLPSHVWCRRGRAPRWLRWTSCWCPPRRTTPQSRRSCRRRTCLARCCATARLSSPPPLPLLTDTHLLLEGPPLFPSQLPAWMLPHIRMTQK